MQLRTRIAIGVAAVFLAGLTTVAVDVYRHPLTRGMGMQRWVLGRALPRHTVDGPTGPVTVFEGGTGPNLVFLHGFADHAGSWYQVAPAFADRWHVVVVDLPGHGDTPGPDDLSPAHTRGAVDAVLATLDGPAVIVGNSMGGWLAMEQALDHPERVSRIVLVNAAGLETPIDADVLMPPDRDAARRKAEVIGAAPVWGAMLDEMVVLTSPPRFRHLFDALMTEFVDARLPELRVPADLLWGGNDGFFPEEYARRLDAALPASRLVFLDGPCGHAPQLFCAPTLVTALEETLAAAPPELPPDLTWLLGCWQTESGARECWGWSEGRFLGSAVADGRIVETLAIEPGETGWRYVASPEGQEPTAFALTSLHGRAVVFENPAHDFPTRIAYERDGAHLRAEVTNATDGFVVDMVRVTD